MTLDEIDRQLLARLQLDATLSMDRIAKLVGVSKTAAWSRIQKMTQQGVIKRQVVIVDPALVGLPETFFIAVKTNHHEQAWLNKFREIVSQRPEITEVHRLAGDTDYLIKVQVASNRDFDALYKRLISEIDLYSVTSSLSMEVLKSTTALPLQRKAST